MCIGSAIAKYGAVMMIIVDAITLPMMLATPNRQKKIPLNFMRTAGSVLPVASLYSAAIFIVYVACAVHVLARQKPVSAEAGISV